jgi:hypothetical protein
MRLTSQAYLDKLKPGVAAQNGKGWVCDFCNTNFKKIVLLEKNRNEKNKENQENGKSAEYYVQDATKVFCTRCFCSLNPACWIADKAERDKKVFPMLRTAHGSELKAQQDNQKAFPIKTGSDIMSLLDKMCPPVANIQDSVNHGTITSSQQSERCSLSPRTELFFNRSTQEEEVYGCCLNSNPSNISFSENSLPSKQAGKGKFQSTV